MAHYLQRPPDRRRRHRTETEVVLVSDFTFASDVVPIDRGYTAGLERKVGSYPTHERPASRGWLAPPGQEVAEASVPKSNADNPPESAPESGAERPGT